MISLRSVLPRATKAACVLAVGLGLMGSAVASPVMPDDLRSRLEEHYKGKRVTLVVSHSSGGSTGVWAQLIANHMARFVPGNPRVVLQERSGAAGLVATQYMLGQAQADGYTLGAIGGSVILEAATAGLNFKDGPLDVLKLKYIGGVGDTGVAYGGVAAFPDGIQSLKKPGRTPVFLGMTGVDHSSVVTVSVLEVLGFDVAKNLKVLSGYSDGAEKQLAMAQGEIDLDEVRTAGYNSLVAPLVENGDYVALWQLGLVNGEGKLVRHGGAPDVPTFLEVYQDLHGKEPEPSKALTYALWTAKSNVLLRPFVLPPNTPDWLVDGLRIAFEQMIYDKEFLADQQRLLGLAGQVHLNGADAEKLASEIIGSSSEVLAIYGEITSRAPFK